MSLWIPYQLLGEDPHIFRPEDGVHRPITAVPGRRDREVVHSRSLTNAANAPEFQGCLVPFTRVSKVLLTQAVRVVNNWEPDVDHIRYVYWHVRRIITADVRLTALCRSIPDTGVCLTGIARLASPSRELGAATSFLCQPEQKVYQASRLRRQKRHVNYYI